MRHSFRYRFFVPALLSVTLAGGIAAGILYRMEGRFDLLMREQQIEIDTTTEAMRLADDLAAAHGVAFGAMEGAAAGRLDEEAIYRTHRRLVNELAGCRSRLEILAQPLAKHADPGQRARAASVMESFDAYRNHMQMATEIASVDAAFARRYIDGAYRHFLSISAAMRHIGALHNATARENLTIAHDTLRHALTQAAFISIAGLLVILAFTHLLSRLLSRRLEIIVQAMSRLIRESRNPPPLPELEPLLNQKDEEIRVMAQAVHDFRETLLALESGRAALYAEKEQAHEMAGQMEWAATHDSLTGLYNRAEFELRLQSLTERTGAGTHHALLYIDLDQFKVVNDTCGHAAGDQMLCQVAVLMQAHMRESDTLARLGGDEFGILLENCSADKGRQIAEAILKAVQAFRFGWDEKTFLVGASIGLVEIAGEDLSAARLLAAADTACYAAKDEGRNRIQVFNATDSETIRRSGEMNWVARINRAFDENRFRLYWQAIEPLQPSGSGERHGEILLRMVDDEGILVPPSAFLPAAERYNLMPRVDRWVVQQSLRWMGDHPRWESRCVSINLSGQSLSDEQLLDFIVEQLRHTGIEPGRICFEITETAAIANLTRAIHFIGALRERGCRFSLDDFGSGLSSFGYLKNLPVDFLKIDGSFVRNITRNPIDQAMVAAINNIGHVMGLSTIAEFVEDDDIKALLRAQGVDFGQGYGIARPVPIDEACSPG